MLSATGETLHHGQNEAEVCINELLSRFLVSGFCLFQKRTHFFGLQARKL